MIRLRTLAVLVVLAVGPCFLPAAAASPDSTFDEERASFSVQFGDKAIAYRVMAVTAMPDTTIELRLPAAATARSYRVEVAGGTLDRTSPSEYSLTAPSRSGLYPLTVTNVTSRDTVTIQLFVLRQWDHNGRVLNGYRIGDYEMEPRYGLEVYEPPFGFIEVTAENKDAQLSPHFRLEQFLCKQTDDTPQYALVRPRLLQQLERILAAVNQRGHRVSTLHVMSGYRTPQYNRSIGNTTEYSRHLYGDAADIYVDADGDQWMDDLTGDGQVTKADARYLAQVVGSVGTPGDDRFNGGMSVYGANAHHGPFVHIDLRGHRARW